jgi:hypothetical protein
MKVVASPWVVEIIRGSDYQITPYRLEGIIVSNKQKLEGKTIGYKKVQSIGGIFQGLQVVSKATR